MEALNGNPVFCVQTRVCQQVIGRKLFINFKSTDSVESPEFDLDEDQLIREICNPSPNIENFKIPLKISQIYWIKEESNSKDGGRHYVVDVHINDKFAIRRVVVSDVIRHYLIIVTMLSIEEKYNSDKAVIKTCGQFIGHRLDLDQTGYEVLKEKQSVDRTNELVNNKITLLDEPEITTVDNEEGSVDNNNYDIYYRPGSKLLTCSINTDKLPDSIGFNEDRIVVKLGEKCLMDVHLPLFIDLKQPVKYKFDDKLCLFRAVFKVNESEAN